MSNAGYIKLFRKIKDSLVWQLPPLYRFVAINILLDANWESAKVFTKSGFVDVARGQLMTSREHLAKASGVSVQVVRTALKHLEDAGFLTSKPTKSGTIITISNYSKYQDRPGGSQPTLNPQTNHQITSVQPIDQPGANQVLTTTNKKEERKEFNNLDRTRAREGGNKSQSLIQFTTEAIEYLNQKTGAAYSPFEQKTQMDFDRLRSKNYTIENIKSVIDSKCSDWLNKPDFHSNLNPFTLFALHNFENYLALSKAKLPPPSPRKGTPSARSYVLGGGERVLGPLGVP